MSKNAYTRDFKFYSISFMFLVGCSITDKSEEKIIGGDMVLRQTAPPVVYVTSGCSAVVVSPYQLLTAGHCIERYFDYFSIKKGEKIEIVAFAGKPFNDHQQKFEATVIAAEVHPSWREKLRITGDPNAAADDPNTLDLGLITLNGNLPILPASLLANNVEAKSKILLLGAGCDSRVQVSYGTLRQAPLSVETVTPLKFLVGTRRTDHPAKLAGACEGDSGGGSFLQDKNGNLVLTNDGKWTLLGISSILTAPRDGEDFKQVLSMTAIRTESPVVSAWLKSKTLPKPVANLKDTEPQTLYGAIDRIRNSIQDSEEYRIERLEILFNKTSELKDKLTPSQIKDAIKELMDPKNSQKPSDQILKKYL
jgi:hypothetical protein